MAVPHREEGFNLAIANVWIDSATSDANIAWARKLSQAMEPFSAGRRYVNYAADDETGEAAARAAFGPNYGRLVELKRRYDPGNLFRLNQNIVP
jgi:hypothetical protein